MLKPQYLLAYNLLAKIKYKSFKIDEINTKIIQKYK